MTGANGRSFRSPRPRPFALTPTKWIDVRVLFDGAVEFFHKPVKIVAFDSKTTHAFDLYRTHGKKEGFRYGPLSSMETQPELLP